MLFQREERCIFFLVINLVKLYLSAKRLIDCIYELTISITIAENVISFSSQFAIASIASRLLRFRLRLRNYRLSYTWHVIFSFSFFRCLEADEATRNAGFSSVRKERALLDTAAAAAAKHARPRARIFVARGKILRKIVGETISPVFRQLCRVIVSRTGVAGKRTLCAALCRLILPTGARYAVLRRLVCLCTRAPPLPLPLHPPSQVYNTYGAVSCKTLQITR